MTVAQLKRYLEIGILIGDAIAKMSDTKLDDKIVAVAQLLAENEAVLAIIVMLLGGDTDPPIGRLTDEEVAVVNVAKENLAGLRALIGLAKIASLED